MTHGPIMLHVARARAGASRAGVTGEDGHGAVDRAAGVPLGEEKARTALVEQAGALGEAEDLVPEELLGGDSTFWGAASSAVRSASLEVQRPPSDSRGHLRLLPIDAPPCTMNPRYRLTILEGGGGQSCFLGEESTLASRVRPDR